jgi:hypothetical protein
MGADFPDPDDVSRLSEQYNKNALEPMLAWIQKRTKSSDEMVQYEEVIRELDKFSPKYCCEMVFCRNVLLPALEKNGTLGSVPISLVAILYTLDLVHSVGTRLVDIKRESNDLLLGAEFDSLIDDKIVSDTCDYRLVNYLSPARCSRSVIGIRPSKH